jgi:hypothetical protein
MGDLEGETLAHLGFLHSVLCPTPIPMAHHLRIYQWLTISAYTNGSPSPHIPMAHHLRT